MIGMGTSGSPVYFLGKCVVVAVPVVAVLILWLTDHVQAGALVREVPAVTRLPWLETPRAYLFLHLFTFIPVFALSFDRNVHFYRKWKYLIPAITIVGALFILWDIFFTHKEVWGFNEEYLLGMAWWGLPVEEILFFFTVPFACVFIYECLNYYMRKDLLAPIEKPLTIILILLFLLIGFGKWGRMYTTTTFLLAGSLLLFHFFFVRQAYRSRFYLAYLISWLPFMIVNGVLTGGYTEAPIVLYNPEEFFGLRISSVPLDDSVYSFLLLLSTVSLFEYFRKNKKL